MVGRETFLIAVAGFPAMKFLGSVSVSAVSGPLAGRASGTLPGQMGIWVWPGEGCQAGCWERRAAHADRMQRVRSRGFIGVPGTRISAIEGRRSSYGARFCGRRKMWGRCRERHGARVCGALRFYGPTHAQRTHINGAPGGLARGGLAGTAAKGSVGTGGGALGERAGFAALRAEAGSHPLAGTEDAFEERGYPEIGVELFEVQAQAGWSEFHVAELRRGSAFQTLSIRSEERRVGKECRSRWS